MNWEDVEEEVWHWVSSHIRHHLRMEARQGEIINISVDPKFIPSLEQHMREWVTNNGPNL
jgi:hypothetical protein